MKAYQQATKHDHAFVPAYFRLGHALIGVNDLPGAEAAFRKGIEFQGDFDDAKLNPRFDKGHFFTAHMGLCIISQRQGKPVEAETAARHALHLDPDAINAQVFLAAALRAQGRFAEALAALGRANEIDSRNGRPNPAVKQWIAVVEHDVKLAARMLQLMKVDAKGVSAAECIELGLFCERKKLYIASVRFFQEAFLANPELADNFKSGNRFLRRTRGCFGFGKPEQRRHQHFRNGPRRHAETGLRLASGRSKFPA